MKLRLILLNSNKNIIRSVSSHITAIKFLLRCQISALGLNYYWSDRERNSKCIVQSNDNVKK